MQSIVTSCIVLTLENNIGAKHLAMLAFACLVSILSISLSSIPQASASQPTTIVVPLYDTTGSDWDPVIQAKMDHPAVPIVAVINNFGGPGSSADPSYAALTQRLHSAGITVIGYTHANYGSRNASAVHTDMNRYKNWYNADGIFIDQMSYTGGDEKYYSGLTSYAKSIGLNLVIGNPGTETQPSYIGTVDTIIIYEDPGYPSIQYLGGWHTSYDKSEWGVLSYGVNSLDKSFVTSATNYIGYLGIGNGTDPTAWEPPLPPYFEGMVAIVDPAPEPPTKLASLAVSSTVINLSWNKPQNSAASSITGYEIERSIDGGSTWNTIVPSTGSQSTSYSDGGLQSSTTYTYRVLTLNSMGASNPSGTASATTDAPTSGGTSLDNVQHVSGSTSSSTVTLASFDPGSKADRLLVVGVSANNNDVASVKFSGVPLTRAASSFYNNDAELWYLVNPTGTGDITVTMNGTTSTIVGAYSFSGVDQSNPIAAKSVSHNSAASSPTISMTTTYPNDLVVDMPSIYGGTTLSNPTCTQGWNTSVNNAITGASSTIMVQTPGTVSCGWTASSADLWDDAIMEIKASGTTSTNTAPSAPTSLAASTISSSQIDLSWTAPADDGGSAITSYIVERSSDNGVTWSTVQHTSISTTYSDTGLAAGTSYAYRVSAANSVGTSPPSNTASATTSSMTTANDIVLNNVQSTSGTTSSSNQITLAGFNAGTASNRLLVVGVSANNNNVGSITFAGVPLTREVSHFTNNDAEFWYLVNPTGTGDITVTMNGPTQAVIGAYSFSGVNQTVPIPTHITRHNLSPSSPAISITTQYPNDLVLDLPSIWGGVTLGSPTCTQQWNLNVSNQITSASSSTLASSPATITCSWTASSDNMWDDAAVEIRAGS